MVITEPLSFSLGSFISELGLYLYSWDGLNKHFESVVQGDIALTINIQYNTNTTHDILLLRRLICLNYLTLRFVNYFFSN